MPRTNIVVVGAGVIGLTTALLLAEDDQKRSITIVAKHVPGDSDIEYASPWAGANWSHGASQRAGDVRSYERATFPILYDLARNKPEAGIHLQHTVSYSNSATDDDRNPWYSNMIKEFKHHISPNSTSSTRYAPNGAFPLSATTANTFTSLCINSSVYLHYLLSRCLALGVQILRADLTHIRDAASLHHSGSPALILINCTGLGARSLLGVCTSSSGEATGDAKMYPIRGQIVVVRNSPGIMADTPVRADKPDEVTYVMERAAGGGTILGGSYQPHKWESTPDLSLAARIMARAVEVVPGLVEGEHNNALVREKGVEGKKGAERLSVVRHGVGLRPAREGGPRVEKTKLGETQVVHCYGHGGAGYQASWGSAMAAKKLVDEAVREVETARAKL